MSALSPDDFRAYLAGKVRAHRLSVAPVHLATGRYAPPDTYAVWHLVCPGGTVLQVVARQGDREVTCRVLPEGEA